MNLQNARNCLKAFDFTRLFIEELGWSKPSSSKTVPMAVKDLKYTRREVAQLSGVVVIEILTDDGPIPDAAGRAAIHKEIAKLHHENVLIFVDAIKSYSNRPSQSVWYWAKRQDKKLVPRSHIFVHGQSGDLLLSKLSALAVDFADFDDSGHVPLLEVTARLKQALDIERVTKKFYGEFQSQHLAFLNLITGIDDERDKRWYASVLMNRLMFIYFLQRKFFLDNGDEFYLQTKLDQSKKKGADRYYSRFLKVLFFEGFAKPEVKRTDEVNALLGKIKYLNGGLFLPHPIEIRWPKIAVPDQAFENLFALFQSYSWNLNDTPRGDDNEINPDVLGYIFEKYINQKAFGAYYTRPEITEYLCERTIHRLILDGVAAGDGKASRPFESMGDLLLNLDAPLCKKLLHDVLPNLRLLDPACGSAAFLVSAMKTLINVYAAVIGKIGFLNNHELLAWKKKTENDHKSVHYFIKRSIITNNLFGVDIMEEAVEIAKLRLFLALVASANSVDDLEPLPNIEFNIMAGNSLIGLMHVDDKEFEKRHPADLFRKSYSAVLEEKNDAINLYRCAEKCGAELQELRDGIQAKKHSAIETLNDILLAEFAHLGIRYEAATWDDKKEQVGKPKKRALTVEDISDLKPFHWGYEFDQILAKGGFDAIITNPPWEIFKPNAKEFFEDFSELVTKKKMTIKEFEKEQANLLKDADIRAAWLKYQSEYPHVSAFYRSAPQYQNQISIVDGKKAGSDTNLYKLFLEQCHNLLRKGGRCGIIIPSGIYTDLGTKQLREMLFSSSELDTLFGLSNEKYIFENVHHAFKFCILSFTNGGTSAEFRAAFRINPREAITTDQLEGFLHSPSDHLQISVNLVRRLAPDSLSVMEFQREMDVSIAKKMLVYPLLGDTISNSWQIRIAREFDMTNDSYLFKTEPKQGRLPLYEGKMFWQFDHRKAEPKYWLDEEDARRALRGKRDDSLPLVMDYEMPRLGYREVSASTNERTMIAAVIPPKVFCNHKINWISKTKSHAFESQEMMFLCGVINSMSFDYQLRQRVTTMLSMFVVYQMPVPRLTEKDAAFRPIAERAARLICTTQEFDDLAKEIFGGRASALSVGVTEPADRMRLRAELDALVAQLYGLTEEEFAYILTTFPLVDESVKQLTLNTYRDLQRLGKLPDTRL
ncbi:MAG: ATP-binding protein [Lentisphaerae bacterium]|nr:ATP-binding protein [Lentisphaerota bacterium]